MHVPRCDLESDSAEPRGHQRYDALDSARCSHRTASDMGAVPRRQHNAGPQPRRDERGPTDAGARYLGTANTAGTSCLRYAALSASTASRSLTSSLARPLMTSSSRTSV